MLRFALAFSLIACTGGGGDISSEGTGGPSENGSAPPTDTGTSGPLTSQQACDKIVSLCASDGGTFNCKPAGFDQLSNADEVKSCIGSASKCDDAAACLQNAKSK